MDGSKEIRPRSGKYESPDDGTFEAKQEDEKNDLTFRARGGRGKKRI